MTTTPCAHEGCQCLAATEEARASAVDSAEGAPYCSDYCAQASEDQQEGECACGHPECDA